MVSAGLAVAATSSLQAAAGTSATSCVLPTGACGIGGGGDGDGEKPGGYNLGRLSKKITHPPTLPLLGEGAWRDLFFHQMLGMGVGEERSERSYPRTCA